MKLKRVSKVKRLILMMIGLSFISMLVAPNAMAADRGWQTKWNNAKDTYEELAEKKKPSKKGIFGIRLGSGIEKALGRLDKAYAAVDKRKTTKRLRNYDNKLEAFIVKKDRYLKELKDEITQEEDKKLKNLLKFLRLTLKSITSDALMFKDEFAGDMAGFKKASFNKVNKTLTAALAFAKKIKASNDVQDFNGGVNGVSRPVSTAVQNVKVLRVIDDQYIDVTIGLLDRWSNDWQRVDKPTDEASLKKELKDFNNALKTVKAWYKDRKKWPIN